MDNLHRGGLKVIKKYLYYMLSAISIHYIRKQSNHLSKTLSATICSLHAREASSLFISRQQLRTAVLLLTDLMTTIWCKKRIFCCCNKTRQSGFAEEFNSSILTTRKKNNLGRGFTEFCLDRCAYYVVRGACYGWRSQLCCPHHHAFPDTWQ